MSRFLLYFFMVSFVACTNGESEKNGNNNVPIQRIAFTELVNGYFQVFVIKDNGTQRIQLSSRNNAAARYPIWTPDGNRVFFIQNDTLWSNNFNGNNVRIHKSEFQILHGFNTTTWHILFANHDSLFVSDSSFTYRTHVMGDPNQAKWSSDEKSIISILRGSENHSSITYLIVTNLENAQIDTIVKSQFIDDFLWTSSAIFYSTLDTLYRVEPLDKSKINLNLIQGLKSGLIWSSSTDQIFYKNSYASLTFRRINGDGSGDTELFTFMSGCGGSSISSDGQSIGLTIYASRSYNLFIVNSDGSNLVSLTTSGDVGFEVSLSP
ncbi:DPP IV N-terminal domain-containing protein [bacterium]|nr:DPP IV N-terminal domain-containing protein [bacterium]